MTPRQKTKARTLFIRKMLRNPNIHYAQLRPACVIKDNITKREKTILDIEACKGTYET